MELFIVKNGRQVQKKYSFEATLVLNKFVFNFLDNWEECTHRYTNIGYGKWELKIPPINGQPAIPHLSKLKVFKYLF